MENVSMATSPISRLAPVSKSRQSIFVLKVSACSSPALVFLLHLVLNAQMVPSCVPRLQKTGM
jgi:hypothetical protein